MKDRIAKLLSVKSIVTLVLTVVYAFLSVTGRITSQDFLTVFTVVIAFYFGTQAERRNEVSTASTTQTPSTNDEGETNV